MVMVKNKTIHQSSLILGILLLLSNAGVQAATDMTVPVIGHAPTANPVFNITGTQAGSIISANPVALGGSLNLNFFDSDGDSEDTSVAGTEFQWQLETAVGSNTFQDISGATGKQYTPPVTDVYKHIRLKITPRTDASITDPYEGTVVYSNNILILPAFEVESITANGFSFPAPGIRSVSYSGFPTTAFSGAQFKINIKGRSGSDFDWSSSNNTIAFSSDGTGTFNANPGSNYEILVHDKVMNKYYQLYFNVKKWFFEGKGMKTFNDALLNGCTQTSRMRMPVLSDVNEAIIDSHAGDLSRKANGRLLNEWGAMDKNGWDMTPNEQGYNYYWINSHSSIDTNTRDHIYLQDGYSYSNAFMTIPNHYFCVTNIE